MSDADVTRGPDRGSLDGLNRDLGRAIGQLESLSAELEALFRKFAEQQAECADLASKVPEDHQAEHAFIGQLIEREKSRNRIREKVVTNLATNTAKGLIIAVLFLIGLGLTNFWTSGGLQSLLESKP